MGSVKNFHHRETSTPIPAPTHHTLNCEEPHIPHHRAKPELLPALSILRKGGEQFVVATCLAEENYRLALRGR